MSEELFTAAREVIAGGVNSPVRAFKGVGGTPLFIRRGAGATVFDSGGRQYIDYVCSWGALILGHAHPTVLEAVTQALRDGLSFGAPTELETQMARRITKLVPSIERLRMVNSGTEAAMSAVRLARGFTGREYIVKFQGGYHGHADALLVKAGSGVLTLGLPDSPGVPSAVARHTLTLEYNDCAQIEQVFARQGEQIAAVIVEPVAGNMSCIPAQPEFLITLRRLCDEYDSLLIFDEVMSGFRVALGGAQQYYSIRPDLTLLGKVIGGGLPVGAFGGRADVMAQLAPDGPVYQAGTLSGNPIVVTAGLSTLEQVAQPGFYERLEARTRTLVEGCLHLAGEAGVPLTANVVGGMFGLFFGAEAPVRCYTQLMACDRERYNRFFHGMLRRGVYLAPSAFEAGFMSAAHRENDITVTLEAVAEVLPELQA